MNQKHRNRKALNIGITLGLREETESLWINGIKQNALFLAKLFLSSPHGHKVTLLNTTDVTIGEGLPWSLQDFPTRPFAQGCDGLDVLIELGGQISAEHTAQVKAQGAKLVSYCCGAEYVQNMEAIIFGRPLWDTLFINRDFDEIWITPHIYALNKGFLQTFRRSPAKQVPFVWHPFALNHATLALPHQGEYRPTGETKKLSVIEPNINVLKFCLYPILIAELAYRQRPELIGFLQVTNADHMAKAGREFTKLMLQLDIVKGDKACFYNRVDTPHFLSESTDIVVSHQWGLALNYFYLECCWQGYPLIHNADSITDLGYFYPEHDLEKGAEALVEALLHHDEDWAGYRDRQRHAMQRFLATDPQLIAHYDDLLQELVAG
jgi:Protein of unknown function (DUF2827)